MGPMGPYGGPPRKKSSPVLPIVLGGGGAFVFLIIVIAVVAAVSGGDDEPTSGSSYSYSASSYSPPTYSSYSPSSTYSYSSYSSYSPTYSSPSSSTTDPGETGYGSPERNKIYKTKTMKSVRCRANLRSNSASAYRRYAKAVTKCLDKAWGPVLASQDMEHRKPGIVVSANPTSPCSGGNAGYVPMAFYCSTNETMYFSTSQVRKYPIGEYRDWMMETAAHEYGHHVQTLMGMWDVYSERYNAAYPNVARYTRINRRMELQPQCLAGMFMGRNAGPMNLSERKQKYSAGHTGDNAVEGWKQNPKYRTHGQFRNNGYWFNRGWNTSRAGSCNTWTANASRVA